MSLNCNEREAFVKLAEAIKQISLLPSLRENNSIFSLEDIHSAASEAIIFLNTPPTKWPNH